MIDRVGGRRRTQPYKQLVRVVVVLNGVFLGADNSTIAPSRAEVSAGSKTDESWWVSNLQSHFFVQSCWPSEVFVTAQILSYILKYLTCALSCLNSQLKLSWEESQAPESRGGK